MSVPCLAPEQEYEGQFLPEGWDEWRTSETCTHEHCVEAADAYATWRAYGRGQTESERLAREDVGEDIRRLKR